MYHPSRETCNQLGKDMLEDAISEALDASFVDKFSARNFSNCVYKCKARNCPKVFQALKFVLNHLKGKHPDIVQSVTATASDDVYYQHFMK